MLLCKKQNIMQKNTYRHYHLDTKKSERAAPLLQAIEREWEERICSGLSDGYMQILRTLMQTVAENRYRRMQNIGDSHVTGE